MAVQIYTQKSNAWRDAYNPLRGMNLGRLMSMLEPGSGGGREPGLALGCEAVFLFLAARLS
jgi:hypothetical protein